MKLKRTKVIKTGFQRKLTELIAYGFEISLLFFHVLSAPAFKSCCCCGYFFIHIPPIMVRERLVSLLFLDSTLSHIHYTGNSTIFLRSP